MSNCRSVNHVRVFGVIKGKKTMEKYVCDVCGWIYDPTVGDEQGGIAPGVDFGNLPESWVCPLCGAGKDAFSLYEG